MPFFIPEYDSLRIHDLMLSDSTRTTAYKRAVEANVRPGDTVLDVGAGTGILALLAARAGAARVYAVEPTGIIALAKRLAQSNGLASRIEFIQTQVEEVDLPDKADCLVSEWLGVFALQENMLPSIASARDRLLRPGGKILPEAVRLSLALVEDEELHHRKIERWQRMPYGLDYSDFAHCQSNDVHAIAMGPDTLLSDPVELARLDMRYASDSRLEVRTSLTAARPGLCHGLAGWFRIEFPAGIALDTAPSEPPTHWNQAFFPMLAPLPLALGEQVAVRLAAEPEGAVVHFSWEITATGPGRSVFTGDTRRARF